MSALSSILLELRLGGPGCSYTLADMAFLDLWTSQSVLSLGRAEPPDLPFPRTSVSHR